MNNPFFPAMNDVGERITRSSHLLLGIDFDGTLAPIVDDPANAFLSPAMRQVLESIVSRPDVSLAIMSGRKWTDLQDRVGIPGVILVGNHGLEIHGPDWSFTEPRAGEASHLLGGLAGNLTRQLRHIPGVVVEEKGLTLSVHHRGVAAAHREEVWNIVLAATKELENVFRVVTAEKAYEIWPAIPWNNGTALKWITDRRGLSDSLVMYLADDATKENEEVFAMFQDGITVKIGDSAETKAQYLVAGPAEVQLFLEWIDQLLRDKSEMRQAP